MAQLGRDTFNLCTLATPITSGDTVNSTTITQTSSKCSYIDALQNTTRKTDC